MAVKIKSQKTAVDEKEVSKFIEKGGKIPTKENSNDLDHRLTLRVPTWLIKEIDIKREKRIGNISRNSLILEYMVSGVKQDN
jgi:hypothetical protein